MLSDGLIPPKCTVLSLRFEQKLCRISSRLKNTFEALSTDNMHMFKIKVKRRDPPKEQRLLGVKIGDGFGSTSLRAPKAPRAKKPSVVPKGDSEVNPKPSEGPEAEKRMLALIDRSCDNSIVKSKDGSETVTKDHHEVISFYKTEDGTEDTKEDKPTVQVDKRQIENVVNFKDKSSESLMERKVTFFVARPEEKIEAEDPMQEEADDPTRHESDEAGAGAITTAVVEPVHSSESRIREVVSVKVLESVLEIRQEEPSKDAKSVSMDGGDDDNSQPSTNEAVSVEINS